MTNLTFFVKDHVRRKTVRRENEMLTVHQVADLTGVSIRTLHYYDEIDLLCPAQVTDTGYRMYDEEELKRLEHILFFRELDLPLKEIKRLMDGPDFDDDDLMQRHRNLLAIKRDRLNALIDRINAHMRGDVHMNYDVFNSNELAEARRIYSEEVKRKWSPEEHDLSMRSTDGYSSDYWHKVIRGSDEYFEKFALLMDLDPAEAEVQKLVAGWQEFLSENLYECSNSILESLGNMYVDEPKYHRAIDGYKMGLAEYMQKAIETYCSRMNDISFEYVISK